MTIRKRLTLFTSLLLLLCLAVLAYLLVAIEHRQFDARNRDDIRVIEAAVERTTRDALLQKDDILLLSYLKFLRQQFPALAYCQVRWRSGERERVLNVGPKDFPRRALERLIQVRDPGETERWVTLKIGIDEDILRVEQQAEFRRLLRHLAVIFLGILALGVFISDLVARRMTRPLVGLSRVIEELAKGKLGTRLEWRSDDEIGQLVQAFNHMSGRLEELDGMKNDFVSSVTHELRSPLGAIESFLNLIESKMHNGSAGKPEQLWEYFGRIRANVQRLSGFINDLLDVAKIERGQMSCTLRPMRIQDVVTEVLQFFEARAAESGVALANRVDAGVGPVEGDPDRLRQVLVNLVANSLKFTPRGGQVSIGVEQYREEGKRYLEVSVLDTGRGMDEEDLQNLFRKFRQGKNVQAGVSGHKGTGLGLVIVKSIVEAHGGRVEVRSVPGQGTQFLFSVRMAEPAAKASEGR